MSSDSKQILVYNIIKFLQSEADNGSISEEAKESIEVAKQCLETAYGLELGQQTELDLGVSLEQIVSDITTTRRPTKQVTEEMKTRAEQHKVQGNEFMKQEKHVEAVQSYAKAIEEDPTNAVYYSNRAAAFNKLERYQEALEDCDEAIALNPDYSKAYGRKGLALASLNDNHGAIENYKKAIELDPSNDNFKTNLAIAEEKAKTQGAGGIPGIPGGLGALFGGGGGGGGGGGMPDISALLNNPATMNYVSQMMQNPAMMQMAQTFMSNMQQGGSGTGAPPAGVSTGGNGTGGSGPGGSGPGGIDMSTFMRAGQQFAQQMQQTSPETIEQLRNQMQGGMGGAPPPPSDNNDKSS